jgi:ribosomal protein L32E
MDDDEESVSEKLRSKKETRKTKVKMAGLCAGYLKKLGVRRWRKRRGRSLRMGNHFKGGNG